MDKYHRLLDELGVTDENALSFVDVTDDAIECMYAREDSSGHSTDIEA